MELKNLPYEGLEPGHLACAGCGAALAMRMAVKALGEKIRVVIPASCWSVIAGRHPDASLKVPVVHSTFEVAPSIATGIRRALRRLGQDDVKVMVWAGDGATYDIGFAALSAAAERNEDIIYVCYDNEAYMNTGIQRSSSTPFGAWTTTTPTGKSEQKKDIVSIMLDHRIPYLATATVAFPEDMVEKFRKAASVEGFRFILVLAPCPTGWGMPENKTVLASRLAVETGIFPLVEAEHGDLRVTHMPKFMPVEEYLKIQRRFRGISKREIERITLQVEDMWRRLKSPFPS